MSVTLSNNDLEQLDTLRASGVTWRAIQAQNDKFRKIPLQSLWKMWKRGEVMPKYRRKDERRRYRISVDAETHTRIQRRAEQAGLTMGEWVSKITQDVE